MTRLRFFISVPFLLTLLLGAVVLLWPEQWWKRSVSTLEAVKKSGELRILTRNSPTSYHYGPDGELTGFDYELAIRFAEHLGVKARFIAEEDFNRFLDDLAQGRADLAAANLAITNERLQLVRFSRPVQNITQQLIYHQSISPPRTVRGLVGRNIEVMANTSHVTQLRKLKEKHPELEWRENNELSSEELVYLVSEKLIDFTVVDSNLLALHRRFHPQLRIAFDLSEPQSLAWALPHAQDSSLLDALNAFLEEQEKNGELARLRDRHYGHAEDYDFVEHRAFRRHVANRLPELQTMFQAAAEQHGLDWKLLAAIGYQESHWNPKAVSPTGVRGIMMLTRATAKQVKVKDRTDPEQSINGGAAYFLRTKKRIPERIAEPDRTWMALAAYNIGFGHLEDARRLTQKRGGDPDRWVDVRDNLPLLTQKKWYSQTRYGYARGREPVIYVRNVRSYYDLLNWLFTHNEDEEPPAALAIDPAAL